MALLACTSPAQTLSPTYYPLNGGGTSQLQVDLNQDGISDVVVNTVSEGTVALLSNVSTGKFVTHKYTFNGGSSTFQPVAAGDFNGDSKVDVVFYNYTGGQQLFYLAY